MKKGLRAIGVLFLLVSFFGCAGSSSYMKLVPENEASYAPDADHALLIFMRPATMGFAIQSSVFDVTEDGSEFVGIVSAKKKVAYKSKPGHRLFMVVGENADFMKADLQAGKTYYSLVAPRMGLMKARFSLRPVHKSDLGTEKFNEWVKACEYYENTDASFQWAEKNAGSIQSKKEKYMKKWDAREEQGKPALLPEDGN